MFSYYKEVKARSSPASQIVLMLHGVGSNCDDMFDLVPYFQDHLPSTTFFSPNGIEKCDSTPFGYQWFSLKDRSVEAIQNELEAKKPKIIECINHMLELNSMRWQDMIVIGFSQGVIAATSLLFNNNQKVKGIVGFCGVAIPPKMSSTTSLVSADTPVCLIHGEEDEVLPVEYMEQSKKLLNGYKVECETHKIENLGHSINDVSIKKAIDFIKKLDV